MALVKPPLGARLDGRSQLARGLVGCWLFNEGGGVKAFDISGRGNHGILTNMGGSSTSGWTAHRFGKGLAFDGTNDVVNLGQPNSLFIQYPITITSWVRKTSNTPALQPIYAQYSNIGSLLVSMLRLDNNVLKCYGNGGSGYPSLGTFTISLNAWTFCAATIDPSGAVRMYMDSRSEAPGTLSFTTPTAGPIYIGGDVVAGERFAGNIDNVRVYNRALSWAEVSELYRNPYVGISMPTRKRIYSSAATNYGRGFFGFM